MSSSLSTVTSWHSEPDRLAQVLAAARLGDWTWDAETDRVVLSPPAAALFDVPSEQPVTWTALSERLDPEDREAVRAALHAAVAQYRECEVECRVVSTSAVRWIAARGRPVYEGGVLRGMVGVIQDVTHTKNTERGLREREAYWRSVSECASTAMFVTDLNGQCTYTNARCQAIWGVTTEEALGSGWARCIHPDDRDRVLTTWSAAVRAGVEYSSDFRVVRQDGSVRWTHVRTAHLVSEGRHVGHVGTVEDITDRRADNEALGGARPRFGNALTLGDFATWVWDIEHDRMFGDANLVRLFGVGEEHAAGIPLADYLRAIHPDDRARVISLGDDAIARAGSYEADYRVMSPDGSMRWVTARGRVDTDAAGRALRVHGVLMDITEPRHAEELLAASERRFRDLAEAMPQMVWIAEGSGRAEFFNRRWTEYTGLSLEASVGDQWTRTVHPEDLPNVRTRWSAAVADARHFDSKYRFRRADGAYRWHLVRGVPVVDDRGRIVRWFGTCTDIHDATVSEEHLRAVIDTTPECVKIVARDGRLVQMNPAGLRMIEAQENTSVCGASVFDLIAPEHRDRWREHHERVCAGERMTWHFEILGLGGTRRWMETHAVPMQLEGECVQLAVTRDITERKRHEQERELLLEAERAARVEVERASRLKDEFLATISHELRTPLNAILGWSTILHTGGEREQIARGLEVIARNAQAQAHIIDDLLDMSRIISGKIRLDLERVELASVVEAAMETARPAADAKGVRLQTVLDPFAGHVTGDPGRLQQVFWNLISNAIKFTPRGGKVQVSLERVDAQLEVSVIDTGDGITPEFVPFLFDRFRQLDSSTTRRNGGLGLGLSIAKQLVEIHGGTIRAFSAGLGHGARFTVTLPLTPSDLPDAHGPDGRTPSEASFAARHRLDGLRILVVDDEPDARELLQRVLANFGAAVDAAPSAPDAIAACERGSFDVLISDIGMPAEDGYALIRRVRKLDNVNRDMPAVALTAYARPEDRRRALLSGYQAHVSKPFEPAELVAAIMGLVRRTSGAPSGE